jgi:hypothetical protein
MSLNGLPVAFGGLGASVMGSSADLEEEEEEEEADDDALESELGELASGCEPPQATSDSRAIDEQRLNRENRLMAFS